MQQRTRRGWLRLVGVVALATALASCQYTDVAYLAADALGGRNNGSAGSTLARAYLLDQLRPIAQGANPAAAGDAAYLQTFATGTNVVAVIPGTDLADEYVVVGAHYDHHATCRASDPADAICNGATDNATGVAVVLQIARGIAHNPTRRSVVVALWDAEEDGLLGSAHYVANPLVPLADTVAYVNFDIQGANLLPSLRNTTFAIGAETGGGALTQATQAAVGTSSLDVTAFSAIFGQYRSDYFSFLQGQVPSVFFSDSTGPCYHTVEDDIDVVDFAKLQRQTDLAGRLTRTLADTATPPAFVPGTPLATYDDARSMYDILERGEPDFGRFSTADQATLATVRTDVERIIAEGRAAFDSTDQSLLLQRSAAAVTVLTHGACDGFLAGG